MEPRRIYDYRSPHCQPHRTAASDPGYRPPAVDRLGLTNNPRIKHCRASHLAACGHTVLPKIGPVIAFRRRTDYQSPNWLSGPEAEVSRPRFRRVPASQLSAGRAPERQYVTQRPAGCRRVVDLHKPGLSGIWIRLPRRRLIFALYFIKKNL